MDLHIRLPKDLHAWLQALADQERRSVNKQLAVLLDEAKRLRPAQERQGAPRDGA